MKRKDDIEPTKQPEQDILPKDEAPAKPQPRTFGLKAFDVFLYPILTNTAVFGISVGATYLTSKGGMKRPDGSLQYGKVGEWFHTRGEKLMKLFKRTGMSDEQANMSKMVFFSFLDGSLMAPVVKKFEDHREGIGRGIDCMAGTLPEDESVYKAEPKQTWGSVLGGRLATCMIVVPTAYALDKTGLNNKLFSEPGKKVGQWLAKKPVAQLFGKTDLPELSKIGFFEFFYTSVCTTGLFFSSRMLSSKQEQPEQKKQTPVADAAPAESNRRHADESLKRPRRTVSHQAHESFSERHKAAALDSGCLAR